MDNVRCVHQGGKTIALSECKSNSDRHDRRLCSASEL